MRTFITFHKILSAICANLYVSQGLVNCMQRCNDTLTACKFVSDSQEGQAHRNDIGTKFTTERWQQDQQSLDYCVIQSVVDSFQCHFILNQHIRYRNNNLCLIHSVVHVLYISI